MEREIIEEKVRSKVKELSLTGLSNSDINVIINGCQQAENIDVVDYALELIPSWSTEKPHVTELSKLNVNESGIAYCVAAIAQVDNIKKAEFIVRNLRELDKLSRTKRCGDTGIPAVIRLIDKAANQEVMQAALEIVPKIEAVYEEYGNHNISGLGLDYPYLVFEVLLQPKNADVLNKAVDYMERQAVHENVESPKFAKSILEFIKTAEAKELVKTIPVKRLEPAAAVAREMPLVHGVAVS